MPGRRQIEAKWGMEFWALIRQFAEQGLCRSEVAQVLGYDRSHFYKMLATNPAHDPFEGYAQAVTYLADTGETFGQALARMSAENRSWNYAATVLGYSRGSALKRAARSRGITIELRGKPGRPSNQTRQPPVDSNFTTGWPTWKQVYGMVDTRDN